MQPSDNAQNQMEVESQAARAPYTPPAIEQVLSPEDLEREVHYAGQITSGPTW
jgi:hypothetical protein